MARVSVRCGIAVASIGFCLTALAGCQLTGAGPAMEAAPAAPLTTPLTTSPTTPLAGVIGVWMTLEDGIDLIARTSPDLKESNVIIHVARRVVTPDGAGGPTGFIIFRPDLAAAPVVAGFIGADARLGSYSAKKIFAGTPFEKLPVIPATIEIDTSKLPGTVSTRVTVSGHVFEVQMDALGPLAFINRTPAGMPPFAQQGLESVAGKTTLKVDGKPFDIIVPQTGVTKGPAATYSPAGIYARN